MIQQMLAEFPSTLESAVIVVQHMPKFFTKPFAERLNQLCPLEVHEANDGELLEAGKILVAPGSHHLYFEEIGLWADRCAGIMRSQTHLAISALG